MSFLKFSTNLFLEKLEMDRLRDFLDVEGFKKNFILTFQPGLHKSESELNWLNGRVEQDLDSDSNSTIKIQPILAINKEGNIIQSKSLTKLSIPNINTWYWVKISHEYSNIEEGEYSIDRSGNLSGTNSKLLTIFRQLPNFPTKIRFTNSNYNIEEYQILEVIDDFNAKLNGVSFVEETGLKIAIVGTFTPGIIVPEKDKYPFNFDSVKIELIEESSYNTEPSFIEGYDFFLARLRILDKQLVVQDKRTSIIKPLSLKNVMLQENLLLGIESVKNTDLNSNNLNNIVDIAWGMRSQNYSIDSSKNIVTLYGSSLGGRYKSVLDFTDGDFNGWRVYTEDGSYCKVFSSIKKGNAINLLVDVLDVNRFSNDGGLTIKQEQILVVPDADFIEIEFFNPLDETNYYSKLVPINTSVLKQELLVYSFPECNYSIRYRYLTNSSFTSWLLLQSDQKHGYYTEVSFDTTGKLKETGIVRQKYTSSTTEGFLKLKAYQNSLYYLRERIDINIQETSRVVFDSDKVYVQLIPKSSTMYQLIDNDTFKNNLSSEIFFLDLSLDNTIIKNGSRFQVIIVKELLLRNKQLNVVTNYDINNNQGLILKTFTSRDVDYAKSVEQDLIVDFLYDGESWICLQTYQLEPVGSLRIFSGTVSNYFDSTGLGRYGGWLGYAICNGFNGTSNLTDLFVLESSSTTKYKKIYVTKI